MRNIVLLIASVVIVFGVYYGGWATASVVSRYFPSCRTFEFSDGRHLTGWHARLGTGEHVVQLRSEEYAVFEGYSAIHPADEAVDCDYEYVRPVDRR